MRVGFNEASLAINAHAFVLKDHCCVEVDLSGKRGRWLQRQYLASNSRSLSSKRMIPAGEPKKLPPKRWTKTWVLKRQMSASGIWYPGTLIVTLCLCLLMTFHLMIPLPSTLFEDKRSLIFMMLGLYVTKSEQRGEIQTEALESTIIMISMELRWKHLGLLRVDR